MPERASVGFDGGPVIAIPESALECWGGIDSIQTGYEDVCLASCSPGDEPTDYDRACAVSGWAMLLSVGAEQGLVMDISDEPGPRVTWVARPYGGLFLSGYVVERDDQATAEALEELDWTPLLAPLNVDCGLLLVSTAAASGVDFPEEDHLRVPLLPGNYEVSVAEYATAQAVGIRLCLR